MKLRTLAHLYILPDDIKFNFNNISRHKGSTINDLGEAEKISEIKDLDWFLFHGEGPLNFFFSIFSGSPPDHYSWLARPKKEAY